MHVIAHRGLYRHPNRVRTGSWLREKNPLLHQGLEPGSVLHLDSVGGCSTNWAIPAPKCFGNPPVLALLLCFSLRGNTAVTLWDFGTEYHLWCSDWLKLHGSHSSGFWHKVSLVMFSLAEVMWQSLFGILAQSITCDVLIGWSYVAVTLRDFGTEYHLWCSDWLKLCGSHSSGFWHKVSLVMFSLAEVLWQSLFGLLAQSITCDVLIGWSYMAVTLQDFGTKYHLWCSDWLKLCGSHSSGFWHKVSLVMFSLAEATWQSLFRILAQSITCDVLIGWSYMAVTLRDFGTKYHLWCSHWLKLCGSLFGLLAQSITCDVLIGWSYMAVTLRDFGTKYHLWCSHWLKFCGSHSLGFWHRVLLVMFSLVEAAWVLGSWEPLVAFQWIIS